jgi:hypothetical protein
VVDGMSKRRNDPPEENFDEKKVTNVKNDAAAVLNAFRKRNQRKLRKLNDALLRALVPNFSKSLFELTVLSYVLSKITSKPRFLGKEYEQKMFAIESKIERLIREYHGKSEEEIAQMFVDIEKAIKDLESGDPRFIVDLITKGNLKVAATVYAQGISLGVASDLTGMNKQDILDYAGKTMMFDRVKEEKTIQDRMQVARRLVQK